MQRPIFGANRQFAFGDRSAGPQVHRRPALGTFANQDSSGIRPDRQELFANIMQQARNADGGFGESLGFGQRGTWFGQVAAGFFDETARGILSQFHPVRPGTLARNFSAALTVARQQLQPGAHSADQSGADGEAMPRYLRLVQEYVEYESSREASNAQAAQARAERTRTERTHAGAMAPLGQRGDNPMLRSETSSSQIAGEEGVRSIGDVRESVLVVRPGQQQAEAGQQQAEAALQADPADHQHGSNGGGGNRARNSGGGGRGGGSASSGTTSSRSGSGGGHGGGRGSGTARSRRNGNRQRTITIGSGDNSIGNILGQVGGLTQGIGHMDQLMMRLSESVLAPVMVMRSSSAIFDDLEQTVARLRNAEANVAANSNNDLVAVLRDRVSHLRAELQYMQTRMDGGGGGGGGSSGIGGGGNNGDRNNGGIGG